MDKQDAIKVLQIEIMDIESRCCPVPKEYFHKEAWNAKLKESLQLAIEALTDHKSTNRLEKIQQMDVEEMAEWLFERKYYSIPMTPKQKETILGELIEYLLQEVEDENINSV